MRFLTIAVLLAQGAAAASPGYNPPSLQGIGIEQRLGASLPLDTQFTNADGNVVPLGTYFGRRPVVFALVYYTCPMLCSQILSGMVAGLRPLSLLPNRDFDVVVISINPAETFLDAARARDTYSQKYSRKLGPAGWHFLVGSEAAIHAVASAAGFHYRYDPSSQMFFHAAGIMVATPRGKLSRYFYGAYFRPNDLKLGLIEASGNRLGSRADQILLYCYHYDPSVGKYGWAVWNLLRAGSAVFAVVLIGVVVLMFRRDFRQDRKAARRVLPRDA